MQHIEKCDKCGKEYDPSAKKGPPEDPQKCDECGADVQPKHHHPHSEFLVDDADDDHHSLEKTLREASHKADRD
ncbi:MULTISPECIES: hypothetical protein [unclassified Halomonas]|uniref:hypothetical protein n=1 Tax=unclassified Halomonas TaxID=2609666 RepID=UPI0020A0A50C|nr:MULTISPECIES: hypothetical protein [unclassified Halomonas]MCP1314060.1 hypothetical protein [Halomonas sp. 707D7]MCP1325923.1 hypothetical protein [Halomonas sp. 707D4]